MSEAFDPYRRWLGIPQAEQPPHHYRLLGIGPFEDDPDVIEEAADRQMSHVQRHKTGKHSALSQKLLNELASAKLCLLDKQRKAAYDQELRAQLPSAQAGAADVSAEKKSSERLHARLGRLAAMLAIAATGLAVVLTTVLLLRTPGDAEVGRVADSSAPVEQRSPPQLRETKAPERDALPSPSKGDGRTDKTSSSDGMPPEPVVAPALIDSDAAMPAPGPPDKRQVKPPAAEEARSETKTRAPDDRGAKQASSSSEAPKLRPPIIRLPVPDAAALKSAAQALQKQIEILQGQAEGADGKLELSRRLREEARQPGFDAPSRYVLLREACDAAAEAGDYAEAETAIRRLAERFEVKPTALKAEAMTRINQIQESPQQKSALVDAALDLIAEAAEADDYPTAERIAQFAAAAARTLKDRDRNEQVRLRSKDVAELRCEYDALGDQRATLQRDPADPQANLAIGSFQCLYKSDWHKGLKGLAQGSDATLKQLASKTWPLQTTPARGKLWQPPGGRWPRNAPAMPRPGFNYGRHIGCVWRRTTWQQRSASKSAGS